MNSWKYADKMKHLNPIDDEFFYQNGRGPEFLSGSTAYRNGGSRSYRTGTDPAEQPRPST